MKMKIKLNRENFKILSDGTDCFLDMLIYQFHIARKQAKNINEIEVDAEIFHIEEVA